METWKSVGKQYLVAIGSENCIYLFVALSGDLCAYKKNYRYRSEHSQ